MTGKVFEPDRPRDGDRPDEREPGLIVGRFRSIEDKAGWMLVGAGAA